jgi:hypothetical protein
MTTKVFKLVGSDLPLLGSEASLGGGHALTGAATESDPKIVRNSILPLGFDLI